MASDGNSNFQREIKFLPPFIRRRRSFNIHDCYTLIRLYRAHNYVIPRLGLSFSHHLCREANDLSGRAEKNFFGETSFPKNKNKNKNPSGNIFIRISNSLVAQKQHRNANKNCKSYGWKMEKHGKKVLSPAE